MEEKATYENNTRIVFDNKLKLCIMNISSELKDGLKSMNYLTLEKTQKELREYFVLHQQELNIAGVLTLHYTSCPDFYALICAVTSDLSKCESWDDVCKQFFTSLVFKQKETLNEASNDLFTFCDYDNVNINSRMQIQCMCSHSCKPENMSIVTNHFTHLNALIACDCLEKTGIINTYEFKKKVKQSDAYAKILVKKAEENQKMKDIVYRWEALVSKLISQNETHRKCMDCDMLSILKTEPDWKKKCLKCYIAGKHIGVCLIK